jgi:glucokinase
MILAGDIGATKTLLALVDQKSSQSVIEKIYPSQNYARFEDLLIDFKAVIADLLKNSPLTAAGFGVAGPVVGERCETTNLPWIITVSGLRELLGCQRVFLINDLEAVGYAIPLLSQQELSPLNPNASQVKWSCRAHCSWYWFGRGVVILGWQEISGNGVGGRKCGFCAA